MTVKSKSNYLVRVSKDARTDIKVLAAERGITMTEMVDTLLKSFKQVVEAEKKANGYR